MTQNTSVASNWFATHDYRVKAQIKYELNCLECHLNRYIQTHSKLEQCPDEVTSWCDILANRYLDYLHLVGDKKGTYIFESVTAGADTNWLEHYALILKLKQELSRTLDLDEELEVVVRIQHTHKQFTIQIDVTSLCFILTV